MARFSGDPEQLPAVGTTLVEHAEWLQTTRTALTAECDRIERAVESAVRALAARWSAAESRRSALGPDHPDYPEAARACEQTKAAYDTGRMEQGAVRQTLNTVRPVLRTRIDLAVAVCGQGAWRLREFLRSLNRASARLDRALARMAPRGPFGNSGAAGGGLGGFGGGGSGGGGVGGGGARAGAGPRAAPEPIGTAGHLLVQLSDIDDGDSRVRGPADFGGKGVSLRDLREGLLRLQSAVLPAVRAGAGPDRMRELDRGAGLVGHPASHETVYRSFFGSGAIVLHPNGSGGYEVSNGYHRIWLARQAGFTELPVWIGS